MRAYACWANKTCVVCKIKLCWSPVPITLMFAETVEFPAKSMGQQFAADVIKTRAVCRIKLCGSAGPVDLQSQKKKRKLFRLVLHFLFVISVENHTKGNIHKCKLK